MYEQHRVIEFRDIIIEIAEHAHRTGGDFARHPHDGMHALEISRDMDGSSVHLLGKGYWDPKNRAVRDCPITFSEEEWSEVEEAIDLGWDVAEPIG